MYSERPRQLGLKRVLTDHLPLAHRAPDVYLLALPEVRPPPARVPLPVVPFPAHVITLFYYTEHLFYNQAKKICRAPLFVRQKYDKIDAKPERRWKTDE